VFDAGVLIPGGGGGKDISPNNLDPPPPPPPKKKKHLEIPIDGLNAVNLTKT